MSRDDILQPLPIEKWSLLADYLKKKWPTYVAYYYFIHTSLRWKSKDPDIPITIYCPDGDYKSGIFVGICSYTYYYLVPFADEGLYELLHKIVTETKYIEWNRGVLIPAIHSRVIPSVYSIIDTVKSTKNINLQWSVPGNCFFKSKEECAALEIQVPDDCYLKDLDESHVPLMHSVWPHRNEQNPDLSTRQVLSMVKFNGGMGLFLKNTNELVSWATQSELGAISLVQTIDRCKRKGYAKLVTNAFAKKLAAKGIDSFVFIVKGNLPSETMYTSLNFKHVHKTDWIQLDEILE